MEKPALHNVRLTGALDIFWGHTTGQTDREIHKNRNVGKNLVISIYLCELIHRRHHKEVYHGFCHQHNFGNFLNCGCNRCWMEFESNVHIVNVSELFKRIGIYKRKYVEKSYAFFFIEGACTV